MICTDDDFVIQIGDKVIYNYAELYYEDKKRLEEHLRTAKILSVTPWSTDTKTVKATDVETADYFLDYCKLAADSLVNGEDFEVGGNQRLVLTL